MDGRTRCLFNVFGLYTSGATTFGVTMRCGQSMSMSNGLHPSEGWPKSQSVTQYFVVFPHPSAQHFVNFGVPQPQIINHQIRQRISVALFINLKSQYEFKADRGCNIHSGARDINMGNAVQHVLGEGKKEDRNTCSSGGPNRHVVN